MKALEHKFFNSNGSDRETISKPFKEIRCSLNGWSISQFLLPQIEEREFAWVIEKDTFQVGSREQYLSWLYKQEELPCLYEGEFPLGVYCVRLAGGIWFNSAFLDTAYCAAWIDFMPLRWAIEGFPELHPETYGDLVPWDVTKEKAHYKGVYKTYTQNFNLQMPRRFEDEAERYLEENNFLQRFLQKLSPRV